VSTNANVEPIMAPDYDAMLKHLVTLFGRAPEGMVEVAWTDSKTKHLRHAELFDVGDLDAAAKKAHEVNAKEFCNVYVGAALRKPGTFPGARAKDDDFYAAWALHIDLDDDGAPDAAKTVYNGARLTPPVVIVTGRHPHTRAQLWWPLDEPITDPELYRHLLRTLAVGLHGDTTVTNPSRVMRLAGTIAWPMKEGRRTEETELIIFKERRHEFGAGEFERAFAVPVTSAVKLNTGKQANETGLNLDTGLNVDNVIGRIKAGEQWHTNMVRVVAHWINRGWSDTEIQLAAQAFTLSGYTPEDTYREVQQAIEGARRKWDTPNAEHTIDDTPPELNATPLGILDPAAIPAREWVLGNRLIRSFVTLTIAPGGIGKSTLTTQEAIAVATGRAITGDLVHEKGKVWLYNNEDPLEELHRRIAAICLKWGIPSEEIGDRIFLDSGLTRRLLVAKKTKAGIIQTPDVLALISEINRHDIRVLVVDPFVRCHDADENDNSQIDFVAAQFSHIAQATGCAISLVHHTRKMPTGTPSSFAGDVDSGRGASALSNAVRAAHTLSPMGKNDAEKLDIPDEDKSRYVRLDDAKGNMSPPAQGARWFQRKGIPLPNADDKLGLEPDEVGVLEVWIPPPVDRSITHENARLILEEVDKRWNEQEPFSVAPQSPRYLGKYMKEELKINRSHAKSILDAWISNSVIVSKEYDKRNKTKGAKVQFYP
jgi:RecA-family ATPase